MSAAADRARDHARKASLKTLLSASDVDIWERPGLLHGYNCVCERLNEVPIDFGFGSSVLSHPPSPPEGAASELAAPPFQNVPPPEPHLRQKEIEVVDAGTVVGGGGVQVAVENVDEVVAAGMSSDYTLKAFLEALLSGGNINASDFLCLLQYYNLVCERLNEVPTKFNFKRAVLPPPEPAVLPPPAAPPLFGPPLVDEPIYSENCLRCWEMLVLILIRCKIGINWNILGDP